VLGRGTQVLEEEEGDLQEEEVEEAEVLEEEINHRK
jgi:hypothetical protein